MVKITCDKCGKDCKGVVMDYTVRILHNYNPDGPLDSSPPCMTHDTSVMRIQLCQDCHMKFGFPNIYKVQRTRKLDFRDLDEEEDFE